MPLVWGILFSKIKKLKSQNTRIYFLSQTLFWDIQHPALSNLVGVGIDIAIEFGIAEVFRFPISTAIPIPIPIPKMLFKPL